MKEINFIKKDILLNILTDYNQLILSGPPGTSKSYLCNSLSLNYDETLHIQFHPQYSYQQFVGGYIVDKADVIYKKGVMLNIIDKAIQNKEKKYLVIIDEINRANTSQVFGDLIQCLDRNNSVEILCNNNSVSYYIPKNIHIIATMNSTDRSIGNIDYALKRRFLEVYCGSNPSLLIDLCPIFSNISLADFLEKMNDNLLRVLKNKEMCIGHAIFLNDNYFNKDTNKFEWNLQRLEILFNYKILPLIEEYCSGNTDLIYQILGDDLPIRLSGKNFENAVMEYLKE